MEARDYKEESNKIQRGELVRPSCEQGRQDMRTRPLIYMSGERPNRETELTSEWVLGSGPLL